MSYCHFFYVTAVLAYAALNFFIILKLVFTVDLQLGRYYFSDSHFQLSIFLMQNLIHIGIISIFVAMNALGVVLYDRFMTHQRL